MLKKVLAVTALAVLGAGMLAGCTSGDEGPKDMTKKVKDENLYPENDDYKFTVANVDVTATQKELPYTEIIEKDKLYVAYGGSSSCPPEIDKVSFDKASNTVAIAVHPLGTKKNTMCTMDFVPHAFSVKADTKGFSFEGPKIEFVTILEDVPDEPMEDDNDEQPKPGVEPGTETE